MLVAVSSPAGMSMLWKLPKWAFLRLGFPLGENIEEMRLNYNNTVKGVCF